MLAQFPGHSRARPCEVEAEAGQSQPQKQAAAPPRTLEDVVPLLVADAGGTRDGGKKKALFQDTCHGTMIKRKSKNFIAAHRPRRVQWFANHFQQ